MQDKLDKATVLDDSDLDAVVGGVDLHSTGEDHGPHTDNKGFKAKGGQQKRVEAKGGQQKRVEAKGGVQKRVWGKLNEAKNHSLKH